MDISNLTKAVTPTVAKAIGDSAAVRSPAVAGNSLPGAGQTHVSAEGTLASNPVSPPNAEELNSLVNRANVTLQGRSSDLKFTVAEGTDISVVRIEDAETGELIRQVPSEAMVAIARALDEVQQGTMLEEKA